MKRSKHSLSNYRLFSCDMGEIIPIGMTEVLPGDSIQQATTVFMRVSPLLAPVMHPVSVKVHHWYVPHRIIWEDWENFITGGPNNDDASIFPTITLSSSEGNNSVGSLADYLGCPPEVDGLEVSALPFRGYAKIFNEWYRDQDLVDELPVSEVSGPDTETNTDLLYAAWEKDYFTSARPWTQKGPDVTIPLGGNAPVGGIGVYGAYQNVNTPGVIDAVNPTATDWPQSTTTQSNVALRLTADGSKPDIYADLSDVTAATIGDVRLAYALQRYSEARARYGSRYTEYLRYLGVRSSDARLQRPEYLGGGKTTITFSEVLQTAEGTDPVASLKGHGISAMRSNRYRRFFEEHGYIHTFMTVRPKTIYSQGLERTWNRRTKEDFWQKELQHIGQQPIKNKEIYAAHSDPEGTFGFQDRYDDYRRLESEVAGEFRTSALDYWHMARQFAGEPVLNGSFVTSDPTKRIYAEQTQDALWCYAKHSIQARRMVAKRGTSFVY